MTFGKNRQSSWTVTIHPDGSVSTRLLVSAEDGFSELEGAIIEFAKDTVGGSVATNEVENTRRVLHAYDIRDHETGVFEGAASGGRALFLRRLFERVNGQAVETSLATAKPHEGLSHVRAAVEANHRFGTVLGHKLAEQALADGRNFFFSPTSIGTAWAMAANGAQGGTLAQMMAVYGTKLSDRELLAGLGAQAQALRLSGAAHSANALYGNRDVRLDEGFVNQIAELLGGQATTLDFGAPGSLPIVNGFVAKHTDQMIPQLLDQLDPSGVVYLINAIGTKVKWSEKFEVARTRDQQFRTPSGVKTVPMMSRTGQFRYFENNLVQGITLETEGGKVAVDFFLPRAELMDSGLAAFVELETLQRWGNGFDEGRKLAVAMPRLKLRYKQDLIPAMTSLGITAPFTDNVADFGRMANVGSFISLFLHEAVLELDEEGAKAAAATAVGTTRSLAPAVPTLVFDRPYVLSFRDLTNGEILFFGIVLNP
jgi:serpin B